MRWIRSARLTDAFRLSWRTRSFALQQPESRIRRYVLRRALMTQYIPGVRGRSRLFVAVDQSRVSAVVHFRAQQPDQRWHLYAMAGDVDSPTVTDDWERLLTYAIGIAGERGVKRLYGSVPVHSPVAHAVRGAGFTPFCSETVYEWAVPRVPVDGPVLRTQTNSDTWAIHQLYNVSVPRQVQYAEAFTSHEWDVRRSRGWYGGMSVNGWLIEEGHHVVAHARASSYRGSHMLELIVHPERTDLARELIDGALGRLWELGTVDHVYCTVRGYQQEICSALETQDFRPVLEQELHIKYTTAPVRLPVREVALRPVEVMERLPKRMPSFFQGKSSEDGAA